VSSPGFGAFSASLHCRVGVSAPYPLFLRARAIGSPGDIGAMRHEGIEWLGILQKEAVVKHPGVIFSKRDCAIVRGDKLKTAVHRCCIVDRGSVCCPF